MKVKFGLKLWSTNGTLLSEAVKLIKKDVFQYVELMPIPGTDIRPFLEADVPYFIHATTETYEVNIADQSKQGLNMEALGVCREWADKLEAKYLILHPGYGSINDAAEFLDRIRDERILIENMPKIGINNEKMVGYTVEQVSKLMNNRVGLCLDFGHAIKAATSLKKDYRESIREFLKLKPRMFHVSDGKLKDEKDDHLQIGEGEYDFDFLISCIKENESKYVTLETPRILASLVEDCKNLEELKSQINSH
jgi:deoxyribonuclease-4